MEKEKLINDLSGGRGYAFLTSAQKQQINSVPTTTGTQNTALSQAQPPQNVAEINPVPGVNLPNTTPQVTPPSDAIASTNGQKTQIEIMQKQEADRAEQARKEAEAIQADQQKVSRGILDIFSSTPKTAETRASAFKEIGIDPGTYFADQKAKIAEIDTLNQEYNKFKSEVDAQKAALQGQGRGITLDLLNNQAAQIDRNAAPRLNLLSANINSKAAVLQALQGNFNEARSFVNQAVEDATADRKFKLDSLTTFYNMNQDSISRLDSKYQNALTNSINLAKEEYDNAKAEKTAIGTLITSNPQAGILITDSYEEAMRKLGLNPKTTSDIIGSAEIGYVNVIKDASGKIIKTEPVLSGSGSLGGATTGFKDSKIESSVREDAVSLLSDVDSGVTTIDKAYSKLRTLYSPKEVTDDALKQLLGMKQTEITNNGETKPAPNVLDLIQQERNVVRNPNSYNQPFGVNLSDSLYGSLFNKTK